MHSILGAKIPRSNFLFFSLVVMIYMTLHISKVCIGKLYLCGIVFNSNVKEPNIEENVCKLRLLHGSWCLPHPSLHKKNNGELQLNLNCAVSLHHVIYVKYS